MNITTYEFNNKGKLVKVVYDAGQYRDLIVRKYGNVVTYGGSYQRWNAARKAMASLAKITGLTIEQVIADIQADYALIEE